MGSPAPGKCTLAISRATIGGPGCRRWARPRSGFTLIEILVVIVVIAVLASMVAPNVFKHVGEAKNVTARSQIEMLGAALDAYRLDNGRYPTTEQGLAALWSEPRADHQPRNWRGFDLLSFGADGKPGGSGDDADIVSWK